MSAAQPAIRLVDAGKRYTKYEDQPMLFTAALRLRARTRRSALWAIRHVDAEVPRGESIGVIGRNGSGKSTLLQMIAGVTAPTEGSVMVRGRVAPLVSVGVGFHPELTGRENVYVNGTILGLERDQIDSRFADIVAFSEIGDFIDTPVKFYSSGMFVRLGFSVAVHADPDVLLVDEVLAVGDLAFQVKCFDRMLRIRDDGTTIVVVSHNVHAVRRMCTRTLLVDRGTVLVDGDPVEAIGRYYDLLGESRDPDQVEPLGDLPGRGGVTVESLELLDEKLQPVRHLDTPCDVVLRVEGRASRDVESPVPGMNVVDSQGTHVYSEFFPGALESLAAGESFRCELRLRMTLASGSFSVDAGLLTADARAILGWARPLIFSAHGRERLAGIVDLAAQVTAEKLRPGPARAARSSRRSDHRLL